MIIKGKERETMLQEYNSEEKREGQITEQSTISKKNVKQAKKKLMY